MSAANPSPEELLAKAVAMKSVLRRKAEQVESARIVSSETIAAFKGAGFFRILQPAAFGGYEFSPSALSNIVFEVGRVCGSTAWTLAVLALHQWEVQMLPPQGRDDIWGNDRDVLLSSAYAPTGKVARVEGGFRLSGRWPYSSGCDHADWAILGGVRPPDGQGEAPTLCGFFVPRTEYTIIDDWFTMGLAGTGSKTIELDDVFVPIHRHHPIFGACPPPKGDVAPVYRIPFGLVFIDMLSAAVLGMSAGFHDFFVERNLSRRGAMDGSPYSDNPDVHRYIAEIEYANRSARALLAANQAAVYSQACSGTEIPTLEKARYLWEAGRAAHSCMEATGRLYSISGANTIFAGNEMQRMFRDCQSGVTHMAFNFNLHGRNYGAMRMGHENTLNFI